MHSIYSNFYLACNLCFTWGHEMIICCEAYCHIVLKYVLLLYLRYWCMKNQFHFQPHCIQFLFFFLLVMCTHLCIKKISCCHCCPCTQLFECRSRFCMRVRNYENWKIYVPELHFFSPLKCTRSSASFITWMERASEVHMKMN